MKRKRNFKNGIIAMVLLISMFVPNFGTQEYQAASSYTNAMMFYESVSGNEGYAAETVNGTIYYATKAKLANSSTNLRYHTLGFDITLVGNGQAVSFSVSRTGGYMVQISNVQYGGYDYILYAIQDQTLFNLAMAANPSVAPIVLDASTIQVVMNAVMTTKQGGKLAGAVYENGAGGLYESGNVYHLNNYSHLATMMRTFSGHTFNSYYNIIKYLPNYQLYVNYNVQGTPEANTNCSSTASVGNGYSVSNGYLSQNGSQYMQSSRVLTAMTLVNPNNIALSKTGYHLEAGREWTALNRSFTHLQSYMPKTIYSGVGYQNCGITMYANWQPNTYNVIYNANSGNGIVASSKFTYDQDGQLRDAAFTKKGYKLKPGQEWNTKPDGTGTSYCTGEIVRNLTAVDGETITLYANWEPCVYSVVEEKDGGTGGTDVFYQKYDTGFYSDQETTNEINQIELPGKRGYEFMGYFPNIFGVGEATIKPDALITLPNNYYLKNTIIYASWKARHFDITFDKQGGEGGTDKIVVTYDQYLPPADAPYRDGYTFKGYFTEPNGQGEMYYNENMATEIIYQLEDNLTLYAYWVDETRPEVFIYSNIYLPSTTAPEGYVVASADDWTNKEITITADGFDYGSGLSNVQIYMNDVLVAEETNLGGINRKQVSFVNPAEGVINFKAVATDMAGNTSEAFKSVYYDIHKPSVQILEQNVNGTSFSLKLYVTDINVQ